MIPDSDRWDAQQAFRRGQKAVSARVLNRVIEEVRQREEAVVFDNRTFSTISFPGRKVVISRAVTTQVAAAPNLLHLWDFGVRVQTGPHGELMIVKLDPRLSLPNAPNWAGGEVIIDNKRQGLSATYIDPSTVPGTEENHAIFGISIQCSYYHGQMHFYATKFGPVYEIPEATEDWIHIPCIGVYGTGDELYLAHIYRLGSVCAFTRPSFGLL